MTTRSLRWAAASAALVTALSWGAFTATITETFDGSIGEASFRIGPDDEVLATGGNPGAFLRSAGIVAAVPFVENVTVPGEFNNFIGRYRVDGVSELDIDLNVFEASDGAANLPISLGLIGGDCEMVLSEQLLSRAGSGWKSFSFHVPAWKLTMPQKWVVEGSCATEPRDDVWNRMMGGAGVTGVRFYLGDPASAPNVQSWTIGVDNVSIKKGKFGTPS